eukprot:2705206-Amphidinium_carterae.1
MVVADSSDRRYTVDNLKADKAELHDFLHMFWQNLSDKPQVSSATDTLIHGMVEQLLTTTG